MEGTLRAISIAVTTGTIINHHEIWNLSLNIRVYSAIWPVSVASCDNPAMVKIIKVMTSDGTVVIIK